MKINLIFLLLIFTLIVCQSILSEKNSVSKMKINLIGFNKKGASSVRATKYNNPHYTYAWYPRTYNFSHIGQDVSFTGVVIENNGVIGLTSYPGGFQPVIAETLVVGSVVKVSGKLVVQLERSYWTDYAIESKRTEIIYTKEEVEKERLMAIKLWKHFFPTSDLRCFATQRKYKFVDPPKLKEFSTNWDSESRRFIFNFAESTGLPRSRLVREFYILFKAKSNSLDLVEGLCYFWEDLC